MIREANDILEDFYDDDSFENVFVLHDWSHVSGHSKLMSRLHYKGLDLPDTILINGRGINTKAKVMFLSEKIWTKY